MDPVKATAAIPMQLVDAGKAKMLVCRLEKPVPAGAQLVLRRAGDDYELVVVQTTGDCTEPATLASFVAPEDADANGDRRESYVLAAAGNAASLLTIQTLPLPPSAGQKPLVLLRMPLRLPLRVDRWDDTQPERVH